MSARIPLSYTLSWPFRYLFPSKKNRSGLVAGPISNTFTSDSTSETRRILFFGDLMGMRYDKVPTTDENVRQLFRSSDLIIGNLESPVTFDTRKFRFYHGIILHKIGLDYILKYLDNFDIDPQKLIMSLANNHIGDQGERGMAVTMSYLNRMNIRYTGDKQVADFPFKRVDLDGLQIGIAAWTHWLNWHVFSNSHGVWTDSAIRQFNWIQMKEQAGLDYLIGTPHWDYEFQHYPAMKTREFASYLLSYGFDLLVGHHPHVLQPVETFDTGLCFYSIGNLNFPELPFLRWPVRLSAFIEIELITGGKERGMLKQYTVHPYLQVPGKEGVKISLLDIAPSRYKDKLQERVAFLFK